MCQDFKGVLVVINPFGLAGTNKNIDLNSSQLCRVLGE